MMQALPLQALSCMSCMRMEGAQSKIVLLCWWHTAGGRLYNPDGH
jgi:hypothetical protein